MFRNLAALALLLPLSFNGIRMVCVELPPDRGVRVEAETFISSSEDPADCSELCLRETHRPGASRPSVPASRDSSRADDGTSPPVLCLLAPHDDGARCEVAMAFGIPTIPAETVSLDAALVLGDVIEDQPTLYIDPLRTAPALPPEA